MTEKLKIGFSRQKVTVLHPHFYPKRLLIVGVFFHGILTVGRKAQYS